MATFFGEVTEVPSRAVWWSDSEDEQEVNVEKSANITFELNVLNNELYSDYNSSAKLIFVSVGNKQGKHYNNRILDFKLSSFKQKSEGNIASLFQINQNEYWLEFNRKQIALCDCFELVDSMFKHILMPITSTYCLILLSTNINKTELLQYLVTSTSVDSHANQYLSTLKQSVDMQLLIAPQTLGDEFELALLEYCIINKREMVCFMLPSCYDSFNFIPNQIKEGFNTNVSYNNIIT